MVDEAGHQAVYQESLASMCQLLQVEYVGWASKTCTFAPSSFSLCKHFSLLPTRPPSLFGIFKRFQEFRRLFATPNFRLRLFFFETYNSIELLLWSLTLHTSQPEDRFLLFIRFEPSFFPLKGKGHRILIRNLSKRLKDRLLLWTDSELLAQQWRAFIDLPLTVVPIPHAPPLKKAKQEVIHCWWPGEPRLCKGLKIIQTLATLQDPAKCRFVLKVSQDAPIDLTPFVTPLPSVLSRQEYLKNLSETDFLFLPYDPSRYRASTSGIFVEGVNAGAIPIVTEGTWMAHELRQFELTECIGKWEDPAFFTSLQALIQDKDFQQKFLRMQEAYRAFHSLDSFALSLKKSFSEFRHSEKGAS